MRRGGELGGEVGRRQPAEHHDVADAGHVRHPPVRPGRVSGDLDGPRQVAGDRRERRQVLRPVPHPPRRHHDVAPRTRRRGRREVIRVRGIGDHRRPVGPAARLPPAAVLPPQVGQHRRRRRDDRRRGVQPVPHRVAVAVERRRRVGALDGAEPAPHVGVGDDDGRGVPRQRRVGVAVEVDDVGPVLALERQEPVARRRDVGPRVVLPLQPVRRLDERDVRPPRRPRPLVARRRRARRRQHDLDAVRGEGVGEREGVGPDAADAVRGLQELHRGATGGQNVPNPWHPDRCPSHIRTVRTRSAPS